MNTVKEALEFYHSLGRFGVNPGLERITALCEILGNPQDKLRYVHVAGTNGKGSTCTFISSVLSCAGYKTGLYTSPYVIDFRERMQIDSRMIGEEELISVTSAVQDAVLSLNEKEIFPTEFEAVTAAAFLWFYEQKCDIVVLETGLGGRYDATNLIHAPEVSVITSISLDHTKVLGDTVSAIAGEKSGIIKPGCPVVTTSEQPPEALIVIETAAKEAGAELFPVEKDVFFETLSAGMEGTRVKHGDAVFRIPFAGEHQVQNASLAVKALELLKEKGFHVTRENLQDGIQRAFIPARTEVLCTDPLIVLDGSHNPGGAATLAALLKKYLPGKKLLGVMGMMGDKDVASVLSLLLGYFSEIYTVTPSNGRAMNAEDFAGFIRNAGKSATPFLSVSSCIDSALRAMKNFDALVVCGSLYLASDVRAYLKEQIKLLYNGGGNKNVDDC